MQKITDTYSAPASTAPLMTAGKLNRLDDESASLVRLLHYPGPGTDFDRVIDACNELRYACLGTHAPRPAASPLTAGQLNQLDEESKSLVALLCAPTPDANYDQLIVEHGLMIDAYPTQRKLEAFASAAILADRAARAQTPGEPAGPDDCEIENMAHSACQEALSFGLSVDSFMRPLRSLATKFRAAAPTAQAPSVASPVETKDVAAQVGTEDADAQATVMRKFYRHVKTGGEYEWLASAVRESDQVIVVMYQSLDTGIRWVRLSTEFYDGRFVRIDSPTAPQPPESMAPAASAVLVVAELKVQP